MGRGGLRRSPAARPDAKIIVADQSTFKALVQRLTGQQTAEAVGQADVAAVTVAQVSAARRGGGTVTLPPPTAVLKPPFKPVAHRLRYMSKLPIIRPPVRPRLAGFLQPTGRSPPSASSSSVPGVDGRCVTSMAVELPPSPPSASTLAEEVAVDAAAQEKGNNHIQLQERRFHDMHTAPPAPAPAPVRNSEAQLLTLFPLTPSHSVNRIK